MFRDAKKLVWNGDSRAKADEIDKELGLKDIIDEFETSDEEIEKKDIKPSKVIEDLK